MDRRTDQWSDEQITGPTDGKTDERTKDKQITGPTDRRTDERTDKRTVGRTDYDFTIGLNDVDLSDVFEYD